MFSRLGDFKGTLPELAVGLVGGVIAYRYFLRPSAKRQFGGDEAAPFEPPRSLAAPAVKLPAPASVPASAPTLDAAAAAGPVRVLDNLDTLEAIGTSRAVVLVTRGFPAGQAREAVAALTAAAAALQRDPAAAELRFFVVADESPQAPAAALLARLGLTFSRPFLVVLDRFKATEAKFLPPGAGEAGVPVTQTAVESFVREFLAGKLRPSLLGQARPPSDANAHCPTLTEVVTESFEEIVLDPYAHVIVEAYTRKCDACKAFAPRYRMLSRLVAKHWGGGGGAGAGAPNPRVRVRVAAMDIADNDKDPRYLPEKWTPAIRFFPATALIPAGGEGAAPGGLRGAAGQKMAAEALQRLRVGKRSVLLDQSVASAPGTEAAAAAGAGGGHVVPTGAAGSGGQKVYLPTLLELLAFMEGHSAPATAPAAGGGSEAAGAAAKSRSHALRLVVTPAMRAEAAALEEEAAYLEAAYDSCLRYMQLWSAHESLLEDLRMRAEAPGAGAAAGELAAREAAAARLKQLVVSAYNFIVLRAGAQEGDLQAAMDRLDAVAEHVEAAGVAAALHAASLDAEEEAMRRGREAAALPAAPAVAVGSPALASASGPPSGSGSGSAEMR